MHPRRTRLRLVRNFFHAELLWKNRGGRIIRIGFWATWDVLVWHSIVALRAYDYSIVTRSGKGILFATLIRRRAGDWDLPLGF